MDAKFIRIDEARAALHRLRAKKIHPHFSGYLCIKQALVAHPGKPVLSHEFKGFFDRYMAVAGAPNGFPYAKPFTGNGKPTPQTQWINANVAGSYAASSIRAGGPLSKVVSVIGTGGSATYHLVNDHPKAALRYFLGNERIQALDLALFFFRDFSFKPDEKIDIVEIFRAEFGFSDSNPEDSAAFETLYVTSNNEPSNKYLTESKG